MDSIVVHTTKRTEIVVHQQRNKRYAQSYYSVRSIE